MNKRRVVLLGGIPVLIISLVLASCAPPTGPSGGTVPPTSFSSNGERIYFTATSASGNPVTPEGFTMMMHRIACVDCHGSDGKGGTVYMMMQQFDVPDITWTHLTEEEHTENGHEEHPPYTVDTVKRAITRGLDPAGNELEDFMPRWQMTAADLNDLVDYLEILK